MDNLNYLAPESFDQAVIAKSQHAENSRVIAGGTDLLLRMRDKVVAPSVLIDLRHTSLNKILVSNDAMSLGASVSLSQILENSEITQHFPALQTACREFAGPNWWDVPMSIELDANFKGDFLTALAKKSFKVDEPNL